MKEQTRYDKKLVLIDQQWRESDRISIAKNPKTISNSHDEHHLFSDEIGTELLLQLHHHKRVAIIGSRKADTYGIKMTQQLSSLAAQEGVVVISGAAQGVDRQAHLSCVMSSGQTLAILGQGLSHIPRSLWSLQQQGMAICSPFDYLHTARKWTFIKRNAWIVGLSQAVIVVQAGAKSGALYTARMALQLGMKVWVIPSLLTDPLFAGNAMLIREGAQVLSSTRDWLSEIRSTQQQFRLKECLSSRMTYNTSHLTKENTKVTTSTKKSCYPALSSLLWQVSSVEPQSITQLADRAGLTLKEALMEATLLELDGWLVAYSGGMYVKSYPIE